jgi:hypothetical protein
MVLHNSVIVGGYGIVVMKPSFVLWPILFI